MKREVRAAVYDLGIESYRLEGLSRPFPNHFHCHFVLGLVERGERRLSCNNARYKIAVGNIVLFNPGDNHGCVQSGGVFDYRGMNISKKVMMDFAQKATGGQEVPIFSRNVIFDEELAFHFRSLHKIFMSEESDFRKEEKLFHFMSILFKKYRQKLGGADFGCRDEIKTACDFIEKNFAKRICLGQICRHCGLSESTLLRAFSKCKGATPHSYLESVRIGAARKLLEQGAPPIEVAARSGFSDQSHFMKCFTSFIGLTPGEYRNMFKKKEKE
ncbi:MAG: AraC family transcriptional regulator, partial [Lachnospiraceae bacterium]|nr:AraC family transcriptional regulator [Lachnospiraceae bacterium]